MLTLKQTTRMLTRGLGTLALAAVVAGPAAAGNIYKWTEADGSVSFTDDAKRIPARYRKAAKNVGSAKLDAYKRYTPSDSKAGTVREQRMITRLERLRELNAPVPALVAAPDTTMETVIRIDENTMLTLPDKGRAGGEPVVVEEMRVRDPDSITTRHVTVVRQGDEILSVVRPRSSTTSASPPSEDELLRR